jgi:hypothetical protein
MNTAESSPAKNAVSLHTEQPVSVSAAEEKDLTTNFYVVGGVINIVMISAYFIWAFRAWKKVDKRKSGNDTAS